MKKLPNLHIYCTNVGKNRLLSYAMAKGTGAPVVPPVPLRPGDLFMYGCLRGLYPTLKQAWAEGRNWYYADNGYLCPGRRGYFRITKNAVQCDGSGNYGKKRWEKLRLNIKPWRKTGSHILVIQPEPLSSDLWGVARDWGPKVAEELRKHTDRPIVIRRKIADKLMDNAPPLPVALENCWAVVVWTSNVAVEALLSGIPVFCTDPCASYRMGTPDLSRIEDPVMPDDREQWVSNLAANQWTVEEMRSGKCWKELQQR